LTQIRQESSISRAVYHCPRLYPNSWGTESPSDSHGRIALTLSLQSWKFPNPYVCRRSDSILFGRRVNECPEEGSVRCAAP